MNESLLKELCGCYAPVGREAGFSGLVRERLNNTGFETSIDALGNVIARKGQGAVRVFAAHIDQECWVVEHKDKKGMLHLKAIPGDSKLGEGLGVDGKGTVYRIYIEGENKGFCAEGVLEDSTEIGTFIVPKSEFEALPQAIFATALGDRIGAAVLLETAPELSAANRPLALVFYTGRHLRYAGLAAGLAGLEIDRLYMLESVAFGKGAGGLEAGNGAALILRTPRSIPPLAWVREIEKISKESGIKLQKGFLSDVSSGADSLSPRGIPSVVLGVCLRGLGSRIECLERRDYDELEELVKALAKGVV